MSALGLRGKTICQEAGITGRSLQDRGERQHKQVAVDLVSSHQLPLHTLAAFLTNRQSSADLRTSRA